MSIQEANFTLFKARKDFLDYLEFKQIGVPELAKYLGKSESYIYQLFNGQANNRNAYANVNKLIAYTNYSGPNWLEV
ncbi:hypothetical protein WS105_0660 [Weissella ceti]|uniref:transcriptional regulator n=1 Tax=Weissella ceti TaxID=759620 RepID=UPI0004F5A407|nr:transcriptional regulator [Weissella ceti]AIM64250.1 hypothetical protein WS105_0660 [Weissella ceti]